MVHCRRIVIVESVASALMDVELCPRVMRESLLDRPLLLGRDVVVRAAEVEKDGASDLSGQAQRVRNGRAVIADTCHWVGHCGDHVCDTATETEAEDACPASRHLRKVSKVLERAESAT